MFGYFAGSMLLVACVVFVLMAWDGAREQDHGRGFYVVWPLLLSFGSFVLGVVFIGLAPVFATL